MSSEVLNQTSDLYRVSIKNSSDLQTGDFYKDDEFLDFIFAGHRASDLNIKRTSNGDRYNINLTPEMTDIATDVPNNDGQYYYGTNYQTRKIVIPFAFDGLTETNLRKIKQWLNNTKISKLVLSEAPYKFYHAKVTDTCQIKHLCFDINGERVYRGEGEITFTCFYPFCQSIYFTLESANVSAETTSSTDAGVDGAIEANYLSTDTELSRALGKGGEPLTSDASTFTTAVEYYRPKVTWQTIQPNEMVVAEVTEGGEDTGTETVTKTILTVFNEGDLPMPFIIYLKSIDSSGATLSLQEKVGGSFVSSSQPDIKINGSGYDSIKLDNREQWVLGQKGGASYYSLANQTMEEGNFFQLNAGTEYQITIQGAEVEKIEFCFLYK